MGEVRSINALRADREKDNTLLSPIECLEDAAADLRSGDRSCNKLLVLMLDADEGDKKFHYVGYHASHLRLSECVALLEIAKHRFLKILAED